MTGTAVAQLPIPENPRDMAVDFAIVCPRALVEVDYKGSAQISCTLYDLTRDAPAGPSQPPPVGAVQHTTMMEITGRFPAHAKGWNVILSNTFLATYGGDTAPFTLTVQTTPEINTQDYEFQLVANFTGPNNERLNRTLTFHAEVNQYDLAHMETRTPPQRAGQDDIVKFTVELFNDGVYPDVYQLHVSAPPGYKVSTPPNVYVPPGESRNVTVSLLTPKGKLYELGKSEALIFKASSTRGTGVYSSVGLLKLSGPYVPTYWIPVLAVGLVAGAITVAKARERGEIRRMERGRPRPVALTPRQSVLLSESKRTDPEAYKARRAQLLAVYAARKAEYREHRKEILAHDREERRVAKAEFKAAKEKRALERAEAKRQAKLAAKEAAIAAKAERKEVKSKSKELRKKQKLLEKARKKQAKVDARQAKKDAKLAAKEAAAQAKADKAAAREAKRAAKAARKRPPEGNA